MNYINEVLGQVFGWFATNVIGTLISSVLGSNVVSKWNALMDHVAGWNQVLPLATVFSIAIPAFGIKMTVRIFRFITGFIPTVHG